jgi:hypothetical protein
MVLLEASMPPRLGMNSEYVKPQFALLMGLGSIRRFGSLRILLVCSRSGVNAILMSKSDSSESNLCNVMISILRRWLSSQPACRPSYATREEAPQPA